MVRWYLIDPTMLVVPGDGLGATESPNVGDALFAARAAAQQLAEEEEDSLLTPARFGSTRRRIVIVDDEGHVLANLAAV